MGLDMYFFVAPRDEFTSIESDIKFDLPNKFDRSELMYYRKHNQLNGWLQELYYEKGGDIEFNCSTMILTINDFKQLRSDIKHNHLKPASGFFWGDREITPEVKKQYYAFIRDAIKHIKDGNIVYYYPNW